MIQPTFYTARLVLRPWQLGDAPDLQRIVGAREVSEGTLNIPHPYPDGLAEQFIADTAGWWAGGENAAWAITLRDESRPIGGIGMHFYPRHARAEIGYWLGVAYWGRGYAAEAGAAILEYGFTQRAASDLRQPFYVQRCVGAGDAKARHARRRSAARARDPQRAAARPDLLRYFALRVGCNLTQRRGV